MHINDDRIKENEEINITVLNGKYQLAGIQYHEVGYEGFWIIDTRKKNFGMDTERALQALNRENEIRKALKSK
ncbi:hypothetical protein MLD52_02385 [Puniceicoccaceae bacterium K14]|nr:hypothetical protein [Puniceicoccaceae bacterium K14]